MSKLKNSEIVPFQQASQQFLNDIHKMIFEDEATESGPMLFSYSENMARVFGRERADELMGIDPIEDQIKRLMNSLESLDDKVDLSNRIKLALHEVGPLKSEPVDCVIWVKTDLVQANDYNPNSVAPPEMDLLHQSILQDGYTQPIVGWARDGIYEVVDGFHRNRVAKEREDVKERLFGYLPITIINDGRTDLGDRMASTIRHNRARGKHKVEAMSDIVIELKRRNWSDKKIAKNLGMDPDEVLRLAQITGLAEMFKDEEFSEAWEVDSE